MTHINNPGLERWMQPTGWICPKCGKVWAPSMIMCLHCNAEAQPEIASTDREYEPKVNTSDTLHVHTNPDIWSYFPNITSGTTPITNADGRAVRVYYGNALYDDLQRQSVRWVK